MQWDYPLLYLQSCEFMKISVLRKMLGQDKGTNTYTCTNTHSHYTNTLFSLARSLRPMYKRVLSHREITHMHTWRCEEPQSQSVHTHVLAALLSRSCTRFVRGISTEIDRSQIPKDKSSRLSPTLCADCPGLSWTGAFANSVFLIQYFFGYWSFLCLSACI